MYFYFSKFFRCLASNFMLQRQTAQGGLGGAGKLREFFALL